MTTAVFTRFVCDRCDAQAEQDGSDLSKPMMWSALSWSWRRWSGAADDHGKLLLCPKCAADFNSWKGAALSEATEPTQDGGE